jgi:AraC-like DNA-binding protein
MHVDDEGHLINVTKVKGRKASLNALIKKLEETRTEGPIFISQADCRDQAEEVAKAAGVSSQHLIRLFRKHLNSTPVGYINRTKVLHAIDLLRNTKLSVKEIAYELGFEDPNYFSRLFKREEGMSPGDTRARICNYDRDRRPSPSKE